MEPKQHDPTATKRRVWMLCLFAAHVLVGVALGTLVRLGGYDGGQNLPAMSFIGLVFAQGSLLGIWAGFGSSPWWLRLPGLAAGAGCVGVGGCIGVNEPNAMSFFLIAITGVMVAIVLTIFRCFRFRVTLPTIEYHNSVGLQFGIRHLLILTVVVAVTLGIGRRFEWNFLSELGSLPRLIFVVLAVFPCCSALVGVLSTWAMLREGLLVVRGVILLAVAAAVGWGVGRVFAPTVAAWLKVFPTQSLVLIASLLVVRSRGYRLIRLPREQSTTKSGQVAAPPPHRHQSQENE